MDGSHDIDRHSEVTERAQHAVFHALHRHRVVLELMILKPNMVLPGKECRRGTPENAAAQQALLKRARLNHLAMAGEYEVEMEQGEDK